MKNKHGGKRKNAGRKTVDDPAIQFCIYPKKSVVDAIGVETAKQLVLKFLGNQAKKILNKS